MRDSFVPEYQSFRQRKMMSQQPEPHRCRCQDKADTYNQDEVFQPSSADSALEGFTGREHHQIGERAAGKIPTTIVYDEKGSTLTYGEVVALAGDYFGHIFELKNLARTPAGREQIKYARWRAIYKKTSPEPMVVNKATPKIVIERYHKLASVNHAHFSAGGYGRQAYAGYHTRALQEAFASGHRADDRLWRDAITTEAFGNHFLTDIFSAGHVRTPRYAISQWYRLNHPDSLGKIIKYAAKFLASRMRENNSLKWYESLFESLFGSVTTSARESIEKLGGEAVKSFSLGDIVSLALHDLDNCGLRVVSDLDSAGNRVPGGYKWAAVGDSHLDNLGEECKSKSTPKNIDTSIVKEMVNSAVKASVSELEKVRAAGRQYAGQQLSENEKTRIIKSTLTSGNIPGYYSAFGYVPREDKSPNANLRLPSDDNDTAAPLQWRWGKLGTTLYWEIDKAVKGEIAGELEERIKDLGEERKRAALRAFVKHLRDDGILVLRRAIGTPAFQSKARATTR